jgi:uncharacterized protein YbjQ (UPF0145 family)
MIITTSYDVPGKQVNEIIGVVTGNTIRAKNVGKDIVAGLRNLVGGEIKEYTEMLAEARIEAIRRMESSAKKRGANAVIGMRLTTATVSTRAAEILAYGTAVKLK